MQTTEYEIINLGILKPRTDILFANPGSGSNKAKGYLEKDSDTINYTLSSHDVFLHIFNLQDQESRKNACDEIKSLLENIDILRVIIAGGDGSLIWAIETFVKEEIFLERIHFGILPFGSGNDLSAMLGWGRDPPSDMFEPYIEEWLLATPCNFDFWLIKGEVSGDGGIGRVNKTPKQVSKSHIEENGSKKLLFQRLMSNYFSIGLDARIGLGFDKHRTKTKCCNKIMYCWEGFKKMFCCLKTPRIPEIISSINCNEEVIIDNNSEEFALPSDTSVLLALNIRTYAGGDNYVWEKARSLSQKKWNKQSANDGALELMIFRGKLGLGLEQIKCTQGQAKRVAQTLGPLQVNFNDTESKCYMQIDGEYYYMEKPKILTIELWERSREVKVLFKTSEKSK